MEPRSDIVLVGAGPANIFLALELLDRGVDPRRILLIDKGASAFRRRCPANEDGCLRGPACAVINGFGGAGMFSDGKLEIVRHDTYAPRIYADRVFDHLRRFGVGLMPQAEQDAYLATLERARQVLAPVGLQIISGYIAQHIGTDRIKEITRSIERHLVERGVGLLINQRVHRVTRDGDGYLVTASGHDGVSRYSARTVVAGIGKSAHYDFAGIFEGFSFGTTPWPPIFGVRYEFPRDVLRSISYGVLRDPLISFRTPSDDEITTFCVCYGGQVVPYSTGHFVILGGQSDSTGNSQNSNFGVLFVMNKVGVASPADYVYHYAKAVEAVAGNKPVIQTYGDFAAGSTASSGGPHRTTIKYSEYFDLNLLLPAAVATRLRQLIESLGRLDPRFVAPDNIVSMPVVEFITPELEVDRSFESRYSGLFFSGVTSGRATGIITAAATGLVIAETLAAREGGTA